jgi:hypothetical protein
VIRSGTLLAVLALGTLAGCVEIDAPVATPLALFPPPAALLDAPSQAPTSVEPRFADALTTYAAALQPLRGARGPAAFPALRRALRRFADALALVPGPASVREPAFQAANDLRVTAARMATTYEDDPRAEIAQARRSLEGAARLLQDVAAGHFAGTPEVLARARAFDRAVRAVDPDAAPRRLAQAIAALDAAERALEAMLKAVVRS